jgi:hypothetical protein
LSLDAIIPRIVCRGGDVATWAVGRSIFISIMFRKNC